VSALSCTAKLFPRVVLIFYALTKPLFHIEFNFFITPCKFLLGNKIHHVNELRVIQMALMMMTIPLSPEYIAP